MKAARHFVAFTFATIVTALTNVGFGLAMLGFAWTIFGCAATTGMTPQVAPADPTGLPTFDEMLDLQWRIHLRTEETKARRTAHLMAQPGDGGWSGGTIRLDDPSAPEGYTVDGRPGSKPWHFHIGYAAHKVIAMHYAVTHQGNEVFRNHFPITTIVKAAGGDKGLVRWYEADLRPDIADITTPPRCVFEIKPRGDRNLAEGKKKVAEYIGALNVAMVGVPPFTYGLNYNHAKGVGVRFKDGVAPWNLTWETTAPGVVQYTWKKLKTTEDSEKGYREAYEQGRWRNLTEQEMKEHGEDLQLAVETIVRGRDVLASVRAALTVPIDAVGTTAEFALSAALWSHMSGKPTLLPVLRKPPPSMPAPRQSPLHVFEGRIRPTPPSPPINARSLGSDKSVTPTAPARGTPRPTTPSKTPSGPLH